MTYIAPCRQVRDTHRGTKAEFASIRAVALGAPHEKEGPEIEVKLRISLGDEQIRRDVACKAELTPASEIRD